jgi:hypothetical protein
VKYLTWLNKLLAFGNKLPEVIVELEIIAASISRLVSLGAVESPSLQVSEPSLEEITAEEQVLDILCPPSEDNTLPVRDGSRLRNLFALLKQLSDLASKLGL